MKIVFSDTTTDNLTRFFVRKGQTCKEVYDNLCIDINAILDRGPEGLRVEPWNDGSRFEDGRGYMFLGVREGDQMYHVNGSGAMIHTPDGGHDDRTKEYAEQRWGKAPYDDTPKDNARYDYFLRLVDTCNRGYWEAEETMFLN